MSSNGDFQEWRDRAACRGPQATVFYPPDIGESRGDRKLRELRAKSICDGCAVVARCLEFAVDRGETQGIWGGTNAFERQALIAV